MMQDRERKVKEFDFTGARQRVLFALDQEKQQMAQLQTTQAQAKVSRQTALTAAQAALAKAEQKVRELREDQVAFAIKAPSDGMVLYGQLLQGNWQNGGPKALRVDDKIQPGQILMTFYTPGKLRFLADIPAAKSGLVTAGRQARVVPATLSEASTDGICGAGWPTASMKDGQVVIPTPVELKTVSLLLRPGDRGSIYVAIEPLKDELVVPSAAVQHGRVRVPGSDQGADVWRDVIVGASDGKNVVVKSGLKEGDEVYAKAEK
jgi:multidrug efflux pump subunit AcrA (membrane-fusion protein)